MLSFSDEYCMYLRKSRADAEAEARGEGETLARHEKALLELARRQRLNVTQIYREVVSGETIAARPVMQQVLDEVSQGRWKGVLVMEVERLARGDTMDQGLVAQTFKFSDTRIVTPMKTYDPANEFDEEYFEFGLFMSRREYKVINRRLQRGRVASVKEGKYVANQPPYGYLRKKLEREKGFTLEPHPEQADVVRMIFELYTLGEKQEDGTYKRLGVSLIVRRLNALKIPPQKGGKWVTASVRDILINPVYIGKVRWNWRPAVKKMVDGQVVIERPRSSIEECVIVDGLHDGIIDPDVFAAAQENISKNPPRPVGERNVVKNPLAGLVICEKCGRRMVRRPYGKKNKEDTLMCAATSCDNVSVALHFVEERILEALREWLNDYRLQWELGVAPRKNSLVQLKRKALKKLDAEIETLEVQRGNVHDLLEQGVYDTETFLDRVRDIGERMRRAQEDRAAVEVDLQLEEVREESRREIIPKVQRLLDVYQELPSPKAKNDLLKEVLEKVVYVKENNGRWHNPPDDFEITLYPKLPQAWEK